MKNTWQTSELILKLQLQHLWQASLSQPMLAGSQDLLKLYLSLARLEGEGGFMGLPPLARLGEFIIHGMHLGGLWNFTFASWVCSCNCSILWFAL